MDISKALSRHRERVLSVVSGEHSSPPIDHSILNSWQRCVQDYGLDPSITHEPVVVDGPELSQRRERLASLLSIARVEMSNLYQQIAGSGHSILLTDTDGVVLNYVGDPSFNEIAAKRGLIEGAVWSEQAQGTNGMGTCLFEQQPVIIHQREHFFTNNLALTCTAAPIFDPSGKVLAVLDASSESIRAQQHTLVLVNMSAKIIENRVFLCMFKNHFIMRFHSRPEFVNTLGEGLIAFQSDGVILAANRSALFQLAYKDQDDIHTNKIGEIFDSTFSRLLDQSSNQLLAIPIHDAKNAQRFYAVLQVPEARRTTPGTHKQVCPVDSKAHAPAGGLLDTLEFGDARMAQNIRIARRVLDRDIPILINGESGTGKGLFAKVIHLVSMRSEKPFVAINCASIPESLIESELFGYKAGAFTGASRHGSPGKIVQADGGTLFLDEIGDMPLSLQARLLRVLEEKEVVPLGGHTPITVDLRVISATHRDLPGMVADGSFREDLYYRLQGVTVTLPPLRERSDKLNLIKYLVGVEAGERHGIKIDESVYDRLAGYYWPGNIRQLRNVLRTLIVLCDSDYITLDDLIDDLFLEARGKDTPDSRKVTHTSNDAPTDPLRNAEREALLRELECHRWNISSVAKRLKISRNTLYRKMKRCDITPPC
ncbi:MAG: sigma-54-dependent Fis family transcriptional regulator [Thiohalobacteraceae bacterium]|nr:sigma-54-dependent Fis family transcriptional regulator [Gammaproteobacteria bacterium]